VSDADAHATCTVGQLARLTGVSPDTIRHYERVGVLPAAVRGANGYRRFPADAARRVMLVRRALDAGFSLADLRSVLGVRDRGGAPCHEVYAMAERRLAELNERIGELERLRDELHAALQQWRVQLERATRGQRVGLLDAWAAGAAPKRRPRAALQRR